MFQKEIDIGERLPPFPSEMDVDLSRFSCGEGEVRRMRDLCEANAQRTREYGKILGPGFREFALYMEPNCYAVDVLGGQLPVAVKVFFASLLFGHRNGRDMGERLSGYIEPNQLDRILNEVTANPPQLVAGKDSALCAEMARRVGNPPNEYRSTYGQLGFILHAAERFHFPLPDLAIDDAPRGKDSAKDFCRAWQAKVRNVMGIS
jgi:hypothetical protein